jgi:hypothetical protein
MPTDQPDHLMDAPGQFEYFMLRVFRAEEDTRAIAGQVERLGTGEKCRFESGGELLALVTSWPVAGSREEIRGTG